MNEPSFFGSLESSPWSSWLGLPATTSIWINQVQMWHDFRPEVVDRELAAAREYFAINTLRVYLQNINHEAEKDRFLANLDQFLEICQRHGIRPGLTFFDDCHRHEGIELDKPVEPVRGYHNGWQPLGTFDLAKLVCRVVPGAWNQIRVAAEGPKIRVWFNRMHPSAHKDAGLRLEVTDPAAPVLSGVVGLRTYNTAASFDNVIVLPLDALPAAEPLKATFEKQPPDNP